MFWVVEVTTRRRDNKVVMDRSIALSKEHAELMAEQTALLMFGDDMTVMDFRGEGKLTFMGENMFDEDVTIEHVWYTNRPLEGFFPRNAKIKH